MKVVVLGSRGMLGTDLVAACREARFEVAGFDLPDIDVTDFSNVRETMPAVCDWVVNCAAYTRVDDAEKEMDKAVAVNVDGAHNVARVCSRWRFRLLHISTDYVFDGRRRRPYAEQDNPNPLGVYGTTKLAGEKAVRSEGGKFLILRTQSLYGAHGPNFVKAILKKLDAGESPLRVVNDQFSSPTYTKHLADAIVRLLKLNSEGVVHAAASGSCSWFDFAKAIAARVKPDAVIEPISAAELARPAPRPEFSVLNTERYQSWTGHVLPTWEEGLAEYLAEEKRL